LGKSAHLLTGGNWRAMGCVKQRRSVRWGADCKGKQFAPSASTTRADCMGKQSAPSASAIRADCMGKQSAPSASAIRADCMGKQSSPSASAIRADCMGKQSAPSAFEMRPSGKAWNDGARTFSFSSWSPLPFILYGCEGLGFRV